MNRRNPQACATDVLREFDLSQEEEAALRTLMAKREARQEAEIARGTERALSLVPRLLRPAVRRLLSS
ncbi:MAG: hypothetical protein CMP06_07060 [Xanthomonadales bacterium]|nr:hypothetical protein [Xanthomonadales bacterium]